MNFKSHDQFSFFKKYFIIIIACCVLYKRDTHKSIYIAYNISMQAMFFYNLIIHIIDFVYTHCILLQ